MHQPNQRKKYLICLVTCLLAEGCATKAEQVRIPTPQEWEVAHERVRAGKSAYNTVETSRLLESHSVTILGHTLSRTSFTIDASALERILKTVEASEAWFTSDIDTDRAFGPDSNKTLEGISDPPERLPWWRPWEEPAATWYAWAMDKPGMLPVRVFFQVSEREKHRKLVYMRIESG